MSILNGIFAGHKYRLILILTVLLHFLLAYRVDRADSMAVVGLFAGLWLLFFLLWKNKELSVKQLIALAMLLRLIYLIAVPELSDDVFRYLWDGLQSVGGVSPYEWTPAEWLPQTEYPVFKQLYPLLNSPEYYSIYPPVLQFYYATAVWSGQGNILTSIVVLRLFVLLAEFGSMLLICKLLQAWKMDPSNLTLYAFNPLVIVEFAGSLHNEAFMVFFLLLSLYLLSRNRLWYSALAFAGSVGVKLLPLIFLPFLIRRIGLWRSVLFGIIVGTALGLMYTPFWSENLVAHSLASLSLYFSDFEFNASVYYLIREVGFWIRGYNIIGSTAVWLPRIVLGAILLLALIHKDGSVSSLPLMMLLVWSIYYALATTVHPWYIAVVAMFLPFVKFRFGLVWMVFVPLSYLAYGYGGVREDLWLVGMEYTAVYGWLLYELHGSGPPAQGQAQNIKI